jgi:hypothetical protein
MYIELFLLSLQVINNGYIKFYKITLYEKNILFDFDDLCFNLSVLRVGCR